MQESVGICTSSSHVILLWMAVHAWTWVYTHVDKHSMDTQSKGMQAALTGLWLYHQNIFCFHLNWRICLCKFSNCNRTRRGCPAAEPLRDHDQRTALLGLQPNCCEFSAFKKESIRNCAFCFRIALTKSLMVIACFPQVFTTSGVCLSELISLQRVEVIQCLDVMSRKQTHFIDYCVRSPCKGCWPCASSMHAPHDLLACCHAHCCPAA